MLENYAISMLKFSEILGAATYRKLARAKKL